MKDIRHPDQRGENPSVTSDPDAPARAREHSSGSHTPILALRSPSDAEIDEAMGRPVADGESVRWYLEQAFPDDEPQVRDCMVREIARVILSPVEQASS
jgi:hypothetical protein